MADSSCRACCVTSMSRARELESSVVRKLERYRLEEASPRILKVFLITDITMYRSSITTLALFAASAAGKMCINQTVPVTLSARQAILDIAIPQTNLEVTDFVLNMTQQGRNFTDLALKGYDTTSGTYNISTQFCIPDTSNITNPTVQVLTHGIGFDKT